MGKGNTFFAKKTRPSPSPLQISAVIKTFFILPPAFFAMRFPVASAGKKGDAQYIRILITLPAPFFSLFTCTGDGGECAKNTIKEATAAMPRGFEGCAQRLFDLRLRNGRRGKGKGGI